MTATSVAPRRRNPRFKPAKPRRDFPLFPHASGQWAKKVLGKIYYFGIWDDPMAAEAKWDKQKHALLEGRNPEESIHGDDIAWLCNSWMDSNQAKLDRGEMTKRSLDDYHAIAKHVAEFFGKHRRLDSILAKDFEAYRRSLPTTWAPTTTNNHLRRVRVLFQYGNDIEATERPFAYRIGLKSVPRVSVRKHQAARPAKEFTREEIHSLLGKANVMMKAYIHLALNCGFGPADIGRLERSRIDLQNQWIGEPRGKTGIARGAWLWPETVSALETALEKRPFTVKPELDKLAFLSKQRRPVANDGFGTSQPIVLNFGRLKKTVGIDKRGTGFYSLRHVCATIGGDAGDQPAINYILGHMDASIQNQYREGIAQDRVRKVCELIRNWLYG